jgi:hypothetical protein
MNYMFLFRLSYRAYKESRLKKPTQEAEGPTAGRRDEDGEVKAVSTYADAGEMLT